MKNRRPGYAAGGEAAYGDGHEPVWRGLSHQSPGIGRGFDPAVLAQLEIWVQQGLQPDLTLWFDLPATVAAGRRRAVRAPDRFERQDEAFFERVSAGYRQRAVASPQRFVRVDAQRSPDEVAAQIKGALEARGL